MGVWLLHKPKEGLVDYLINIKWGGDLELHDLE